MTDTLKILMVGDVVGKPGREAFIHLYPRLKRKESIDFCVVNAENAAGGSGVDEKTVAELLAAGADVLTSGDHIWRRREVLSLIDKESRLLRPANYPPGAPGRGSGLFPAPMGLKIGVINLLGRVFMEALDCPFRKLSAELEIISRQTNIIVVDFHAEATSEKRALAHYSDGRLSALIGTHTHIPTADEQVLPGGTAYITDAGMTGGLDSTIGVEAKPVIKRFLTGLPVRFSVSNKDVHLQGVVVEVDPQSGRALSIRRVKEPLKEEGGG